MNDKETIERCAQIADKFVTKYSDLYRESSSYVDQRGRIVAENIAANIRALPTPDSGGDVEAELESALCAPDWAASLTHVHNAKHIMSSRNDAAVEALRGLRRFVRRCVNCPKGRGNPSTMRGKCDCGYADALTAANAVLQGDEG